LLNQLKEFKGIVERLSYASMDCMPERDSFVEEEQHFFDPNDDKHS